MCRSGLLLVYALKIAHMSFAKFLSKCCERCSRLVERCSRAPFIRGLVVKLLVTTGINICDRGVECRLRAGGHAVPTTACAARETQKVCGTKKCQKPDRQEGPRMIIALADARASDTIHTSIHCVGSFANESVISVSQAHKGARSRNAVTAGDFDSYGLFA